MKMLVFLYNSRRKYRRIRDTVRRCGSPLGFVCTGVRSKRHEDIIQFIFNLIKKFAKSIRSNASGTGVL